MQKAVDWQEWIFAAYPQRYSLMEDKLYCVKVGIITVLYILSF